MRILLVHTRYLQQGGEDVVFETESSLLEDAGHDVQRFVTSNAPLQTMSRAKAASVSLWNETMRTELRGWVARFQPDVVHFHNTFPLLSPASYYAVGKRAVVQTLHNYRLICPSALLFRAGESCERCVGHFPWPGIAHGCYRGSRAATATVSALVQAHHAAGTWKRVHAFIALTAYARELFVRGGLPAARVFVKSNFVKPDPGVGVHQGAYYLYAGRLEEQKGVRALLAAWRELEQPPLLRVIGDGPLRDEVRQAAFESNAIEYAGMQPHGEVLRQMADARALIFPSLSHENCPLTILEAFATGLPVLASATGNLEALLADGGGWTYRPGDARELAAAVRRIDSAASERARTGIAARLRWTKEFTAAVNLQQLESIYNAASERALGRGTAVRSSAAELEGVVNASA